MDDGTLLTTIQGDATALSLANLGRDDDCARRVNSLPGSKEIVSTILYDRDIVDAFAAAAAGVGTVKLDAGVTQLNKLQTLAATSATAAYVWGLLTNREKGWDIGTDWAQKYLNGIAQATPDASHPYTIAEKTVIANMANKATQVTGADVTRVWAQFRVGGKVA